jgi:hypothetical protein
MSWFDVLKLNADDLESQLFKKIREFNTSKTLRSASQFIADVHKIIITYNIRLGAPFKAIGIEGVGRLVKTSLLAAAKLLADRANSIDRKKIQEIKEALGD